MVRWARDNNVGIRLTKIVTKLILKFSRPNCIAATSKVPTSVASIVILYLLPSGSTHVNCWTPMVHSNIVLLVSNGEIHPEAPILHLFLLFTVEHFRPHHTVRRAVIITTINNIVILGILQFTLEDGFDVLIVGESLGAIILVVVFNLTVP
jgi:hypothetical protein